MADDGHILMVLLRGDNPEDGRNATCGLEGWQGRLERGRRGDEQRRLFGVDPVFIDEDVLAAVVKGLNRQSAAGT